MTLAGLATAALERLITMLVHIGLSLVVWRAVERRQIGFLALAILLHAVVDFPAGLYQAGQLSGLAVEGMLVVVGAALAAVFTHRLPARQVATT
jgi:uncharacterized membrane protein YhfC